MAFASARFSAAAAFAVAAGVCQGRFSSACAGESFCSGSALSATAPIFAALVAWTVRLGGGSQPEEVSRQLSELARKARAGGPADPLPYRASALDHYRSALAVADEKGRRAGMESALGALDDLGKKGLRESAIDVCLRALVLHQLGGGPSILWAERRIVRFSGISSLNERMRSYSLVGSHILTSGTFLAITQMLWRWCSF